MPSTQQVPSLIKRYGRSRLYDTASAAYVTIDELRRRDRDGEPFVVIDSKSGEDITRIVIA